MKSQSTRNVNIKNKNIKRSAYIQYHLKIKGLNLSDIAKDLQITPQAVWRVVTGVSVSNRVNQWLKDNLNIDFD